LLAGRIKILFDPVQSTLAQVHAGNLWALAVSSKARSLASPDIPTIAESGFPGSKRQRGGACLRLPSCPPQ
jgi:tripartite-type tricarboxylate transporter receptor subunit TctC